MKGVYGWLLPNGEFVECSAYQHLETIMGLPQLTALVPEIDGIWNGVQGVRESCEELIESGEYPEWHSYDMAKWDAFSQIAESLYHNGCLRIASAQGNLHFEGYGNAIQNLYQRCKDLAEGFDMQPVFENLMVR